MVLKINESDQIELEPFSARGRCPLPAGRAAYLTGPVQVLPVPREVVEREEGVGVPRGAVAQPVPLPQQPVLPDHVRALVGGVHVPFLSEDLHSRGQGSLRGMPKKLLRTFPPDGEARERAEGRGDGGGLARKGQRFRAREMGRVNGDELQKFTSFAFFAFQ